MTQTIDRYSLLAFAPVAIAAVVLAVVWWRRGRADRIVVAAAIASVGAIVAVTLAGRMLKLDHWGGGTLTADWLTDAGLWRGAFDIDRAWLLNAALFVPAGASCTLASGRPAVTIGALAAVSFVIEMVQRWTFLGAADVADLVANVIGAAAGAVVAVVVRRRARGAADACR